MLASSSSSQVRLQGSEGAPSGASLPSAGDQAEGVLDLPVGELVRAGLPVRGNAEPRLVSVGQAGQRGVHPGQLGGPASARVSSIPVSKVRTGQLAAAHPGGQQRLDPRRDAGGVDDGLEHGQRDAHRCRVAAEQRHRLCLTAGVAGRR